MTEFFRLADGLQTFCGSSLHLLTSPWKDAGGSDNFYCSPGHPSARPQSVGDKVVMFVFFVKFVMADEGTISRSIQRAATAALKRGKKRKGNFQAWLVKLCIPLLFCWLAAAFNSCQQMPDCNECLVPASTIQEPASLAQSRGIRKWLYKNCAGRLGEKRESCFKNREAGLF